MKEKINNKNSNELRIIINLLAGLQLEPELANIVLISLRTAGQPGLT